MFEKSLNSISFASPLKSALFSPEPKPTKLQNASTLQSPPVNTPSNSNRQDYSPFIIKNSFYTNSTSKTLNFLTEKKRKSSTKVYTPSPNVSKGEKFSDRFIPMNKGLNLLEKFNLANAINEDDENLNSTNLDKDSIYYQKCVNYNEVLKRNVLMSENLASSFFNNRSLTNCTSTSSSSNRSIKSNIFSFKTNSKQKQQTLSSMITHRKNTKQKMPFGNESYLDEEEHTVRKINKKPYKIIPVDDLIDDFYLNLVDWSSHNDIAAGLGNAVGLWSSNQTQHSILCSYEDNDENGKYVSSVIWSPSGEHIAVGNSVGEVEVYDINQRKLISVFNEHTARVGVVAWNNNNVLSSGSKDCTIISRDIRCKNTNENSVFKCEGHVQEVCGLKWSFDGTYLASGGNDNKLMLWNLHSQKPILNDGSHTAAVKAIAWSPHHHNVLASGGGTADRTIRFWNTTTLNQTNKIDTGSQVCNLVFSKTSNELVSTHGFSLNQIIVWKLPTMSEITTLTGHSYRVLYLGLSPDGENIITGAGDGTLRFWNVFPPYKSESSNTLLPSNKDIR